MALKQHGPLASSGERQITVTADSGEPRPPITRPRAQEQETGRTQHPLTGRGG